MNKFSVQDIIDRIKDNFEVLHNSENKFFTNIASAELINNDSLDWINVKCKDKINYISHSKSSIIVCDNSIRTYLDKFPEKCFIIVADPKLFIQKIYEKFFKSEINYKIEESANIDKDAILSDKCYIGKNVIIGKSTIGNYSIIGENTFINDNVIIGNNVIIQPGCTIGTAGFGFVKDKNGFTRFPQIGKVIIKDNVEIGSNSSIARGALSDTIIGEGTKIDNLVHIAHNVKIGNNCIITSGVHIGGSTTIGNNVWIGIGANIIDNITIGDNVIIGVGSVVLNSLISNKKYVGNPATTIENFINQRIRSKK